jgi:hypothetical protein
VFGQLFKLKPKPVKQYIVAQLNAKVMPLDRGELFEDPLDIVLKSRNLGEISGGGTLQAKSGEIEHCDLEIECQGLSDELITLLVSTLESLGAPKGSVLHIESQDRKMPFGNLEGLAVYLNGTDLPDEIYKECDSNFVRDEFERLLGAECRILSWWQGPTETALYMYGASFATMRDRLASFISSYPLCQQSRVVQIA